MKFQWNEEAIKSSITTKRLVSSKEIVEDLEVFMKDGVNVTVAVCNILKEVMLLEETKARVGTMLKGDPDEEREWAVPEGVELVPQQKFETIEEELAHIQGKLFELKALRHLEGAGQIVKLKDFNDDVNVVVNNFLKDSIRERISVIESRR